MTTLPEKLSREIERVTIMRCAILLLAACETRQPVAQAAVTMTAAIEAGHIAQGRGDAAEMIIAVRQLEGCML